ncbi:MAG: Ig-like domain-containing protein [Myxococcales bacterium]|nr:Ig-like domain-containing protein [Myxococcales bacterium]
MAPHLSITFSRPMVAVSSQTEAARTVPATLEPEPPGSWRWLGTRTLMFKPDRRFPMATRYKVTVPAGTRAASGQALAKAHVFEFETPAPQLRAHFPKGGSPVGLSPLISLHFDQHMDPDKVLQRTSLRAGKQTFPLRVATQEERDAADRQPRDHDWGLLPDDPRDDSQNAGDAAEIRKRRVFLIPLQALPKDTKFQVHVDKGIPSEEGPRTTEDSTKFGFHTYPPLELVAKHCGWGHMHCLPTARLRVELNNPLDPDAFKQEHVKIEPAVPGVRFAVDGKEVRVLGRKKGRSRYQVTLLPGLQDRFGQRLQEPITVTFNVDPELPWLKGPNKDPLLLDPAGPRALTVHSVNVKQLLVTIHRVQPSDWEAWKDWRGAFLYGTERPGPMPGKAVQDGRIAVQHAPDEMVQTLIPLDRHLNGGRGHFAIRARMPDSDNPYTQVLTWVQVTDIGLTVFADGGDLLVWATRLSNGAALPGVKVNTHPKSAAPATTDAEGLTRLTRAGHSRMLVATKGGDSMLLPQPMRYGNRADVTDWYTFDDRGMYRPGERGHVTGWVRLREGKTGGDVRGFGRQASHVDWELYGPRRNKLGSGQAKLSKHGGFSVPVEFPDDVNLGRASLKLQLVGPQALVRRHSHNLQIQEFRRPEFEVSATTAPGPWILGEEATVTLRAAYYAGGGLAATPVSWTASANTASYRPPNRDDYSFGEFSPRWWWHASRDEHRTQEELTLKTDSRGESHLGVHFQALNPAKPMRVTVEGTVQDVNNQSWSARDELLVHPAAVYVGLKSAQRFVRQGEPIDVDALVVDLDGHPVAGREVELRMSRRVHSYRLGQAKTEGLDPITCKVTPAQEPARCTFTPELGGNYRIVAKVHDGQGRLNRTTLQTWVAGGPAPPSRDLQKETVRLIPERESYQPGETARVLVQAPFYPAQGLLLVERSGIVDRRRFAIKEASHSLEIPVKASHMPGFQVQVELVGQAARKDDSGQVNEGLPKRAAYASGTLSLDVPPLSRTLSVEVFPEQTGLDPGGKTHVQLHVTDAKGKAVSGAEVVLVVADEAVLALSDYTLPDPIQVFYAKRNADVSTYHGRDWVLLSDPQLAVQTHALGTDPMGSLGALMGDQLDRNFRFGGLGLKGKGRGGGGTGEGTIGLGNIATIGAGPSSDDDAHNPRKAASYRYRSEAEPRRARKARSGSPSQAKQLLADTSKVASRTDFSALALYLPEIHTDRHGKARVPLELPHSLTRYRVMAVAVHGEQHFGKGEANVTARLPLMVRPSAPRFANLGDRFELPVVVQNQTDKALTALVGLRASNVLLGEDPPSLTPGQGIPSLATRGVEVQVPADGRVQVLFPVAAQQAGSARFQVIAVSDRGKDAASFKLPVYTPATTEAFATYGAVDEGATFQQVQAPDAVWPQFGGLEITTSSTQLQALTDAFLYLVRYPFECNEQIASRLLAITALRDVLDAFETDGLPDAKALESFVEKDLQRLSRQQGRDGGFAFWRSSDRSWPYLTVHVAHAIARAQDKGYQVKRRTLERLLPYLRNVRAHIPGWYSPESRRAIIAYALRVRALLGEPDGVQAQRLLSEAGLKGLSMEALGFLLPILHETGKRASVDRVLRHAVNHVTQSAAGAHFVTRYSDGAHVLLHSDRRVDGVMLDALIQVHPDSELISKLVEGLLAHRKRGKWYGTQENAFVLLALERYFRTYEKETPDFVARVWLGQQQVGEHPFKGRTTERAHQQVPMSALQQLKQGKLALQKDGVGRMYYRIGMRYAPQEASLPPADHGFAITRSYEAVDDKADVARQPDGSWRIKSGARVRVRVTMVSPMRRYHVALVDPLPAGLEPINPVLSVSGSLPADPATRNGQGAYWWWNRSWYEHQNMRDDRVEAFTSLLEAGVHEYTYVARATTRGEYVVAPTRAEEMYNPETFGRAASERVRVTEAL